MNHHQQRCSIWNPADLLGAVPYLLGFRPENSFVALLLDADHLALAAGRADLVHPTDELARRLREAFDPETAGVVLLGYGPIPEADRLTTLIRAVRRDIAVIGGLWVADGEYRCVWDGCACPARQGVAFDARATVSAAWLTARGLVAAGSREELLAELAPDPVAQARIQDLLDAGHHVDAQAAVDDALRRGEQGERLSDAQAAALVVALRRPEFREQVWRATDDLPWQRQLWFDLTRRVPDAHVSVVAALAAWWAWRTGHELFARAALDRAVGSGSPATLALIVAALVTARIDPESLPWPLHPAQVSAMAGLRSRIRQTGSPGSRW
ncbi:DUF4192 domain-containing protein [Paractinoplanes toevensis]|uniref:DUF4192 domain-containing protein n=1 Tax=Paractinoplanes toevensis TaxID=571911 RepID=A0A920BR61_9ACTN|nr:DUF4192 domain-containing protein [Actinoplanes toevensis]GIM98039.1 hypothetical protein Ato02nite_098320 [Actinoplanes toevensis]